MKTDKELVLSIFRKWGIQQSVNLQSDALNLTSDVIYLFKDFFPLFSFAKHNFNMLERNVGFICQTKAGRMAQLMTPYDSDIENEEPEELPNYWKIIHPVSANDAKPFIYIENNPYNQNDYCIGVDNNIYRSIVNNNFKEPTSYPIGWEMM